MAAERVTRLAGGDDEDRAVGIGEIIDAAIARAVHIGEGGRARARGQAPVQGEIAARGRLPDVHQPVQDRRLAEHGMVVQRLMRIAPAPAFDIGPVFRLQLQERLVKRDPRDVGAGLDRCRLHHVAPAAGALGVAEHALDEQRLEMGEFRGERAELVADQPVLQVPHPGGIDQRLGQVLVHVAIPGGEQFERALAQPFGRALGCGLAGEPQVLADERQQVARGGRDGVELGRDEAFARMHLALAHQPRQAQHALAVAPVEADIVGEGAVDHLVVGVDDDAALGVEEARVVGIGQPALPAVHRLPARRGHPSLRDMARIACRDRADRHHADAGFVGEDQVLGRRDVALARRHRRRDRARLHQREPGAHRGVGRVERGPVQRDDIARGRDRGEVEMPRRQHRAVVGPAQGDGDGLGVLHLDDRVAGVEGLPAVGRAVALGIGGVQLFDVQVLVVDMGRGDAPAEPRIAPAQHQRQARDGGADDAAGAELEPGKIPPRRRGEGHVRIVRQQRATGRRAARCGGDGIRGTGEVARREGRHPPFGIGHLQPGGEAREKARVIGKCGDACTRHVRQDILHPVLAQHRDARPQHLGLHLACGFGGQKLEDGDGIGGRPVGDIGLEQEELGRAAAKRALVHLFDPGVDAAGIGLERGFRLFVLRRHRFHRRAVKVEAPHQLVGLQRLGAEDFAQPALHGAAQHGHLPQPVLRMGKAEGEEHVGIGLAEDMRHVLGRAHDLDRGRDAGDAVARVVIGQRARGEIPSPEPGQDQHHERQRDKADHPAKQGEHRRARRLREGASVDGAGREVTKSGRTNDQRAFRARKREQAHGEGGISGARGDGVPDGGASGGEGA
ncbi:hypothetical protein SDC9_25087 [bioreactor metagenome]|uniref:Uncharacterized protein n=1 Tax=bioreactor metagenome TaxID=1076179 RepID=A0A644UK27_9ZZZZ